jgi:hypothetical protein
MAMFDFDDGIATGFEKAFDGVAAAGAAMAAAGRDSVAAGAFRGVPPAVGGDGAWWRRPVATTLWATGFLIHLLRLGTTV